MIAPAPVAALVAAVLCAVPAAAQTPTQAVPLDSGALIRLGLADGAQVRGRLLARLSAADNEVVFCAYPRTPCQSLDEARRLQTSDIRTWEVATGNRAWRGAFIGVVAGAVVGGLGAYVANALCEQGQCVDPAVLTVTCAVGGGVWGAVIGSQVPVWRPAR